MTPKSEPRRIAQGHGRYAAEFLTAVAQEDLPGAEQLARAAASYAEEAAVLRRATEYIPLEAAGAHCVTITRLEARQALRRLAQQAKEHEEQAVVHLERALAKM